MNKDNFFDTWLDIDTIEKKKIKKEKKNENNDGSNISNTSKPDINSTRLL
jgi:hypothetical protein